MLKLLLTILVAITSLATVFSQTPIDVADNSFKVSGMGEEVFYYAFAAGDQVIFNFEESKGKELKEIEVIEYPATSKFMHYKSVAIQNKVFHIQNTGVYKFRFANGAVTGKVCTMTVQRIPASESTANFNTSVYWKTVYDTTYTTEQENYLITRDTAFVTVAEPEVKVHSTGNLNGNNSSINFLLPANTVAWSYYLGVDQSGQLAYERATAELAKASQNSLLQIARFSPGAAIILQIAPFIARLQSGEDIDYYLTDNENAALFNAGQAFRYYKGGKIINDFARMEAPRSGMLHFCFSNDNAVTGVQVTVKITAMTVTEKWGTRPIQRMHVASREVAYWK